MKQMRKTIALILAIMMLSALTVTVSAAGEGSITIQNTVAGMKYSIYQLMDLESYNKDTGAYSYKVNADWSAFFTTGEGKNYVTIDTSGYVTWTAGEDAATTAAFAQAALAYAKANSSSISPVETQTTTADGNLVFDELDLGWYLIDSDAGALCGLTTTNPDVTVTTKNGKPTIDKQVQEDLSSQWGDVNSADIGQIVNFRTTVHVAAGAENYVLHDKMSEGLTFEHNKAESRGVTQVKHITSGGLEAILTENTEYTVVTTGTDDCDFEVRFSQAFIATLKANDRIVVEYNAMLNRYAVIDAPNTNESWMEYGEEKYTTHDTTETYTFSIDIVKTDSAHKLIDGAQFRIYDAVTGGNEIAVVPLMKADDVTPVLDSNGNPMYRRARSNETGVSIEVKGGVVTIIGFDNGDYYLEETVAPAGYNKLTARQEFTIADNNLSASVADGVLISSSGVHVINKTGNMLPETGGMGTTLFVVFGLFAVLGTGVLLVTKKRMGMIRE